MNNVKLPSDRSFGFFFSLVFVITGIYLCFRTAITLGVILCVLSVITIFFSLVHPQYLHPLNKVWMKFGYLLGMVISPIVLGFLYLIMFVPVSTLFKIIGRDELRIKKKTRESLFINKTYLEKKTNNFKQQF